MSDHQPISESMKFRYGLMAFSGTLMAGLAVGAYWLLGQNAILFSNSETAHMRVLLGLLFVVGIVTAITWGIVMLTFQLRHAIRRRRSSVKDQF